MMNSTLNHSSGLIEAAGRLLSTARRILFITGAGLSADSGLPIEWRSHWQAVRQQAQHLFRLVDLPSMVRDQERPETAPHMQVTKSEQCPSESSHHDLRALLMLRNPVQQAKAVLTLEQAGYTVDVTGNGPRTYYSVMLNDYSIVIVDIDLPGDEGFDTLEALRLLPPDRVAPSNCLFALTAERTADRVLKCTDLGVDGMFLKPLKLEALRQALAQRADVFGKNFPDVEGSQQERGSEWTIDRFHGGLQPGFRASLRQPSR